METIENLVKFFSSYPVWARLMIVSGLAISIFTAILAPRISQVSKQGPGNNTDSQDEVEQISIVRGGQTTFFSKFNIGIKLDADRPYENDLTRIWIFYPRYPNIILTESNKMEISIIDEFLIPFGQATPISLANIGNISLVIKEPIFKDGKIISVNISVIDADRNRVAP